MRRRVVAVAVAGLVVGVAAESGSYLPEEPGLAAAAATVGLAFIGLGWSSASERPLVAARLCRSYATTAVLHPARCARAAIQQGVIATNRP
jgi:hypothetical protein